MEATWACLSYNLTRWFRLRRKPIWQPRPRRPRNPISLAYSKPGVVLTSNSSPRANNAMANLQRQNRKAKSLFLHSFQTGGSPNSRKWGMPLWLGDSCSTRPDFPLVTADLIVPTFTKKRLLRNSCRPLKRTRFVPLPHSRHCRAALMNAAASRLNPNLSHLLG